MKEYQINNFNEKIYVEKLPSNLKVYLIPYQNKQDYFAMFGTFYGSDNISFKVNGKLHKTTPGIAHFLEHKMFDTENTSPFDYFAKSGTDVNAYTTSEYTLYHIFGNESFKSNLKYLLNMVSNFKTTKEKVTKEQGIILEEERMYEDDPNRVLYERLISNSLIDHPRRLKAIGSKEDIKNISKEELDLCYKSFYRPDNMFILISGKINVLDTINLIKETLKDFKNPKEKIEKTNNKEPDQVKLKEEIIKMNVHENQVGHNIKLNKELFKKFNLTSYELDYYLQIIFTICFGQTSDFEEELLNKNIINSLSYNIGDIKTHYLISIFASSNKPKEYLKELKKYLNKLTIDEKSFDRTKKVWIASEIRMIDNINNTCNNFLDDIISYRKIKPSKIEDIKKLRFNMAIKVLKTINSLNTNDLIIEPLQKNNKNSK